MGFFNYLGNCILSVSELKVLNFYILLTILSFNLNVMEQDQTFTWGYLDNVNEKISIYVYFKCQSSLFLICSFHMDLWIK